MSSLPEPPVTLARLAQFHREVVLGDIEKLIDARLAAIESRLGGQFDRLWDGLLGTSERLETQYVVVKSGLVRLEERLDRLEQGLRAVEARLRPP